MYELRLVENDCSTPGANSVIDKQVWVSQQPQKNKEDENEEDNVTRFSFRSIGTDINLWGRYFTNVCEKCFLREAA